MAEDAEDCREEAVIGLVEHRTKEVEHLHKRISYYNNQKRAMASKRILKELKDPPTSCSAGGRKVLFEIDQPHHLNNISNRIPTMISKV